MRNLILALLFIFQSVSALAVVTEAEVREAIRSELFSLRQEISSDWRFYHYFTPEALNLDVSTPEARVKSAQERMHIAMDYFWNAESGVRRMETAGRGIYAAIDPIESQVYGSTALVISIKPDAPKSYFVPLKGRWSVKTFELIREFKVGESSCSIQTSTISSNLAFMLKKGCEKIREIMIEAIAEARIIGFAYVYGSTMDAVCFEAFSSSAFVFFGLPAFPGLAGVANTETFDLSIVPAHSENLTTREREEKSIMGKYQRFAEAMAMTVIGNHPDFRGAEMSEKISSVGNHLQYYVDEKKRPVVISTAIQKSKLSAQEIQSLRSRIQGCK